MHNDALIDLAPYRLTMQAIPASADAALARGVGHGEFPRWSQAGRIVADFARYPDGVTRASDGRVLVVCRTEMPRVAPHMIDWWFGWHVASSERYKLWHPLAHLWTQPKEDRSFLADDKARYVGNVSLVDEYIGRELCRLAIAFQPPESCAISAQDCAGGTAVCALTSDRKLRLQAGGLVHLVVPDGQGAQMRSMFWLGEMSCRWPLIGPAAAALLNMPSVRKAAVRDRFALDLYRHCAEEMNHLARFLPALYAQARPGSGFNAS